MKTTLSLLSAAALLLAGCGDSSKSSTGTSTKPGATAGENKGVLRVGNGSEPQGIDPHIVTGVTEHHIISALMEGLVGQDPKDLHPVPGAAEKWDVSDDLLTYTFHLQPNGKWSNGDAVVAEDFVKSYQRILSPKLASEYAYMLYVIKGAEEFNQGKTTDFGTVGVKAVDARTLQVQLRAPTPYLLSMLAHYSWYPVHLPTIQKYGPVFERGNNSWTQPGKFVGNGPFILAEWKQNQILTVKKSPTYWDAATVKLNEVQFHPLESEDTEERAFRTGQIEVSYTIPPTKIAGYQKENPQWLRNDDYLGTYFYRLNVTKPPLNNKKVRQALALTIDRKAIVEKITRAGQKPAYNFTPHIEGLYDCGPQFSYDPNKARQLLAEAGYPGGKGLPKVDLLFNTLETHRTIAEAIQQMWKKELGIEVELQNQEWKVYLDAQRSMNYQACRAAWIGDYADANSFLDMWLTGGGNNQTGWSNAEYDRLIKEAGLTGDQKKRAELFKQAEVLLMDEMPIIPIYFYTRNFLIKPEVKGWYANILDMHPWKNVSVE